MTPPLQAIIDDQTLECVQYGSDGPGWWSRHVRHAYRGTLSSATPVVWAGGTTPPDYVPMVSFSVTFQGTSIAFVGITPEPKFLNTAMISIDGGAPSQISYPHTSVPTYLQWYKSPTLPPGNHTISVTQLEEVSLDYVVVDLAEDATLAGKRIVVDDSDPSLTYAGAWSTDVAHFEAGEVPDNTIWGATTLDGYPFANRTHSTNSAGSIAALRFSGTALEVYGIFDWTNIGVLSISFSIDGESSSQTYTVSSNTPQRQSGSKEIPNHLFFQSDSIPAGDHTLIINVTRCENMRFILDYITYVPSFATPADLPLLEPIPHSSLVPAQQGPSRISAKARPTIGVIIGAALAGLVIVCILVFALWRYGARQRQTKRQSSLPMSRIITPLTSERLPGPSSLPFEKGANRGGSRETSLGGLLRRKTVHSLPHDTPPTTSTIYNAHPLPATLTTAPNPPDLPEPVVEVDFAPPSYDTLRQSTPGGSKSGCKTCR